ncbi:hypothetical protein [Mesorhizobium koreense]|uniref:hypothetical protein n=1 Tax=Mesorhizobium koreense TaxID=3074855 RepID=UPI00287B762E|nr:hypothetical protein [Mesorhizobium sp. WR6]
MRLANEITITVDGVAVTLRPTLRAAYRLEETYGFKAILTGITEGQIVTMAAVIREAGDYPAAMLNLLTMIERDGSEALDIFKLPLLNLVGEMIGVGDEEEKLTGKSATVADSSTESFGTYFERLFSIGTGWLGWTPADTWRATPAEIVAAQKGRVDMLRAIFGGKDGEEEARKKIPLSTKVSVAMESLRARFKAKEA